MGLSFQAKFDEKTFKSTHPRISGQPGIQETETSVVAFVYLKLN